MKKKELNEKQKQFCLEYLKDFNATRAYKKIYGGNDNSAGVSGFKLLRNPKIQEYLGTKAEKKLEQAEVGVDYVLKNLHEIVEIGMGRQDVELEEGKKKKVFDLKNANSALEKLGKYHKMYTDRVENDGDVVFRIMSFTKDPEEGQN